MQTKTVIWIEPTSPWDNNLTKTMNKFNVLSIDLQEGKHHGVKWTLVPVCVEVGARGAINEQPWKWMCKHLGVNKCSKCRLTQGIQDAAVACSYYILLCRFLRTLELQAPVATLTKTQTIGWHHAVRHRFLRGTQCMNKTLSTGFKHWTFQQLGSHHIKVVPISKPAIQD